MRLAIFDLDHTLIAGDSDYLWGRFLVENGHVDGDAYEKQNQIFYRQYCDGTLDIDAFCRFSFAPLAAHSMSTLLQWRSQFVRERIEPIVSPQAHQLLGRHRRRGDLLVITTATNSFITQPIARILGVDVLLATDPEFANGRFTGQRSGVANFREGKVRRLESWLSNQQEPIDRRRFYSDSHNDLALLRWADEAVAVDPDDRLKQVASQEGWPIISLRENQASADLKSLLSAI